MRKSLFIQLITLFSIGTIFSQAVEPSSGVGSKTLQIEMEGQFANEKDGSNDISSWLVPNTLIRYGLSNRFEVQFNVPYLGERFRGENNPAYTLYRFDDIQLGTSINLWKQNKIVPEAALMVRAILPTSDISLHNIGEIVALNFSNQLTNKFTLNYNLGYIHEVAQIHSAYYVLNLSFEPNNIWHFYIENTGEFHQGEKTYELVSGGFGVNLSDNFTADFSLGKGINKNTYYTGLIMSWAIDTSKI